MNQPWIFTGAVSGFLSVALGAFGAHALAETLEPRAIAIYQTAVQYQMAHSLALVGLGIWISTTPALVSNPSSHAWAQFTGWAFSLGILLFSGSLYALAVSGIKILGAITPLGGLLFLAGWMALAILCWKVS
jgi:uncharacterized membrane protein YgdD (TMEM256/DUF423 family)